MDLSTQATAPDHVDVLVVGAGLSGIGAGCHLQTDAPGTSYEILEARGVSGGTWDLFRYPGVRSDSDMFTLGYRFKPWKGPRSIVDGADILAYLRETAQEFGVEDKIRYHRRVVDADWSAERARWTVTVEDTEGGERTTRTCGFLYLCSGYYDYAGGHAPTWPGMDRFDGQVLHPQAWPAGFDATGKRIVVIGSGATAVTIVPALADAAASITMLQRSPSYLMPLPAADPIAGVLRKVLPADKAYRATRWKNVRTSTAVYEFCQRRPERAKKILRSLAVKRLPAGFDVDKHFTPTYDPWDQRMCLVPDGDFFKAVKRGKAQIVTDHIEAFEPRGLRLCSGELLEADVVISATGLELKALGGVPLSLDGRPVVHAEHVVYKGMMLDGVPNLAFAMGYTNASWTLKVDLVSSYVSRVIALMRRRGQDVVTPRLPGAPMERTPFIKMSSGYFDRVRDTLPTQGTAAPWRLVENYRKDATMFLGPVDDGVLDYATAQPGQVLSR